MDHSKQIPGQVGLFRHITEELGSIPEEDVKITGVINIKTLSDFNIRSTYRDIFLIINMLDDYVRILKNPEIERGSYIDYMTEQFERISRELTEQIGLDKEKMYKRCRNRQQDSDIGEDAITLVSRA